MVVDGYKANPIPLPSSVESVDVCPDISSAVRARVDASYHPKEITMVITFRHSEQQMITLMGIGRRYWAVPTMEYEGAFENGLSYKAFYHALHLMH